MRVLFDGYWWVRGPGANKTVMREFILEWRRQFPDDALVVAVRKKHEQEASASLPAGIRTVTTRIWPHGISTMSELALIAARLRPDVIVSHNYTPLAGPTATFIHDFMYQERRSWFTKAELLYFAPMAWSARRAKLLLTSTRTEAARIERLNPRLRNVVPIQLAVASELIEAPSVAPDGFSEDDRFAISVGRLNVRKNLATAIEGARRSASISPDSPLLVVGDSQHSGVGADLPHDVRDLVASGEIRFLGRLSDGELKWLYEHAALTVYLSHDEGFGLPPVEAAAFGSPVLVSDLPVFRETVGDAAFFVDPSDPDAVAAGIDRAWGSGRAEHPIPSRYSWSATVAAMRDAVTTRIGRGEASDRG